LVTIFAGIDTHYGGSGFREADFLLQNAPNKTNHRFWADVDGYWTGFSQEDTWTHSDRPTNGPVTGPAAYFNTLEHNLNTAIYYCAKALNYVITYGGYTDCVCSGENPPGWQQPNPGEKEGVKEGVKIALDETQALIYFSFAGLAASMLTLTMQKLLVKLIEKGISLSV